MPEISWPVGGSVVHVRGVVFPRAHGTDGVNVRFSGPHGGYQLVVDRASIVHVDPPSAPECDTARLMAVYGRHLMEQEAAVPKSVPGLPDFWRSLCATGEELA